MTILKVLVRRYAPPQAIGFLLFFIISGRASAQTASFALSSGAGAPGKAVSLSLSLSSTPGSEPAGVQWTLNYAPTDFSAVQIADGPAATAARKSASCTAKAGAITCLSAGINANTIANGAVAVATFTISPTTTSTSSVIRVGGTVAASLGGRGISTAGGSGSVTISQSQGLSALSCNPITIDTPGTSSCTVTLTRSAPSGGVSVALSSNNSSLTVPASMTVLAGSTNAGFTATAAQVAANATAVVTATLSGASLTFPLTLVAPIGVSSLDCNPASVSGGASSSCTVTLTKAAPAGGAVVSLSSSNAAVKVPDAVSAAAGATTARFTANTMVVLARTAATVSASLAGTTASTTLTVVGPLGPPPPVSGGGLSDLTCSPNPVTTPGASTCAVTLGSPAPPGGITVALFDNSPYLSVPASVTVSEGVLSASFTATAAKVPADTTVVVTATWNGASKMLSLTLLGPLGLLSPPGVYSLACEPATVTGGTPSSCTVTLTKAAPPGGLTVSLSSGSLNVMVPSSTTVAAGATSVTFTALTAPVLSNVSVTLTASGGGRSAGFTVTVLPLTMPLSRSAVSK